MFPHLYLRPESALAMKQSDEADADDDGDEGEEEGEQEEDETVAPTESDGSSADLESSACSLTR